MVWKYEFLKCDFGFMESWNHHVPFNSSTDCSFKITEGTLKILKDITINNDDYKKPLKLYWYMIKIYQLKLLL